MSDEINTADPPGPPETKPASRTVCVLTSWKLWTVLLVLGVLGIGVSLTMPIVHRLRALAYFDLHKDIEYELSREHEDWPENYGEWTNALREVDTIWAEAATDETLLHAAALHEAERVALVESETHPITRRGAECLPPFERLEELELLGPGFTDDAIASMLAARPPLHTVHLFDTGASRQTLMAVSRMKSIEELTIMTRSLHDENFRDLQSLESLTYIMVTGGGDECLKWLAHSHELASINLYFTPITDDGLRYLRAFPKLEVLCIDGGLLTDAGLQYLAEIPTLRELCLIECPNLSDEGISWLPDLPELESLAIPAELLTWESIARLKELPQLSLLEVHGSLMHDSELSSDLFHEKWTIDDEPVLSDAEFWEAVRQPW